MPAIRILSWSAHHWSGQQSKRYWWPIRIQYLGRGLESWLAFAKEKLFYAPEHGYILYTDSPERMKKERAYLSKSWCL